MRKWNVKDRRRLKIKKFIFCNCPLTCPTPIKSGVNEFAAFLGCFLLLIAPCCGILRWWVFKITQSPLSSIIAISADKRFPQQSGMVAKKQMLLCQHESHNLCFNVGNSNKNNHSLFSFLDKIQQSNKTHCCDRESDVIFP